VIFYEWNVSAGYTTVAILQQMLDAADGAFIVHTAEDELADGSSRARENVVHEAGLFQGTLGFNRAIILLENGCNEYSNIAGLSQIRFDKGRIAEKFGDVELVIQREFTPRYVPK
jgi:predicted nucleotide-binding protein